jgi:hypothetical protein
MLATADGTRATSVWDDGADSRLQVGLTGVHGAGTVRDDRADLGAADLLAEQPLAGRPDVGVRHVVASFPG